LLVISFLYTEYALGKIESQASLTNTRSMEMKGSSDYSLTDLAKY